MSRKNFKSDLNSAAEDILDFDEETVEEEKIIEEKKQTKKPAKKKTQTKKINEPQKVEKTKKELKSERINLLVRPTTYNEIKKIAYMKQKSINELLNMIMEEIITKEKNTVEKYNQIFSEKK